MCLPRRPRADVPPFGSSLSVGLQFFIFSFFSIEISTFIFYYLIFVLYLSFIIIILSTISSSSLPLPLGLILGNLALIFHPQHKAKPTNSNSHLLRSRACMELSGETASPAPEPEPPGQPEVSPRGAGMFEDAVEGSSTATESPVAVARPDGEATTESSSPSASRTLAGDEPAAAGAGEVEAYGGDESPSVSEPREESGSVDTGSAASPSVLRSEQRARGAEEQENSMAAQSGEGSPAREETKSRISSAPSSPVLSGTSTSSSSPLSQIKHQARHVRTGSFQRFRQQMQRAWKWGPIGSGGGGERSPREQLLRTTVNFEAMAHQKRQWYQIQSKSRV
jgi:hypothetical protein